MLIRGSRFNDELVGTEGSDRIFGLGGDDFIRGFGGNDLIYGGDGADEINGGAGKDELYGNGGSDLVSSAGDGKADIVHGGSGNDRTVAGYADRVYGDAGDDFLQGVGYTATGGGGEDIFFVGGITSNPFVLTGKNTILDFHRGEDKLTVFGWRLLDNGAITGLGPDATFAAFDTNHDNKIGRGDEGVSISAGSLRIVFRETDQAFANGAFHDAGEDGWQFTSGDQTLTIKGASALLHSDWSFA